MKTPLYPILLGILSFFVLPFAASQDSVVVRASAEPIAQPSLMDWFKKEGIVKIELQTDVQHLKLERQKRAYQPASLTFFTTGEPFHQEVKVRARGKFRCRICDLPPLKLKFSKKRLKNAGFAKFNKLKVVVPCQNAKFYQQIIFKEYLIYRMYNLLTDKSLRVHFTKIELQNEETSGKPLTFHGFIIEDKEELAARLNAAVCDTLNLQPAALSERDYTRFQVFQFMIGNTDWIIATSHNVEVIQTADNSLIPVPYDFDFSGMVASDYATPHPFTPLKSVKERFFMGNGKSVEEMEQTFAVFKEKKTALFELIKNFDLLGKKERKKMTAYLNSFFDIIDDPQKVRNYFIEKPAFMPALF